MTSKKVPFYIVLIIIVSACNKEKTVSFSTTEYLHGTEVSNIAVYSSGNVYMNVVDTFLVIVKSDTPFVNIYSTNSHDLLLAFGDEGRGPKEFMDPSVLKMEENLATATVFLHDYKRNTLAPININKVLRDEYDFQLVKLPTQIDQFITFLHYYDQDYMIATPVTGGNLVIYKSSTDQFITVPYLPKIEFNIPSNSLSLSEIYRPAVLFNKERKKIAAAPILLGEIDFFDLNGELISASIFEPRSSIKSEVAKVSSGHWSIKQQILELDNYRDLIIALNNNIPIRELGTGKSYCKLQIFDWDGNPIKEFLLDTEARITSFAVDEMNNRIYAYTPFKNEHNLLMYNLPSDE